MKIDCFATLLDSEFFTGVPDSQLKPLCDYLIERYGVSDKHIIAANEGNAVALATGYYLATKKVPIVYLQNSGIGNIINPVTSLTCPEVYGIPILYIVGWRGEPGVHDEPQHKLMGTITEKLLNNVGIETFVVTVDTTEEEVSTKLVSWKSRFAEGKSAAFIIKKGALTNEHAVDYRNDSNFTRESALNAIIDEIDGVIIGTTGKTSREIFEIREQRDEEHSADFLTVGSMGHCSSIALGIALAKPKTKVICVDGDGAFLMHMGAASVIGASSPSNLIHIVINNRAHESVGGMPTALKETDICAIARASGYKEVYSADSEATLKAVLLKAKSKIGPIFIEIRCAIGSRKDLGRPTITPKQSKENFMKELNN